MKLTIISHGPFSFDGQQYLGQELFGNYIDKLAPYFSEIIVCAAILRKGDKRYNGYSNYTFKSPNITFVELPADSKENSGILQKILKQIKLAKVIFFQIRKWELIYIFMPSYAGAITFFFNKIFSKPFFVYLASDWEEISSSSFKWNNWRGNIFYNAYECIHGLLERKIVSNSPLTLTAGKALFKKYYANGKPIVQTAPMINLSEKDLYYREDTCQSSPIKCLFVGGLIPRKGLTYLIKAISILHAEGYKITLQIAGIGEQREELEALVRELGINDIVTFLGYISNGPELFKVYRESDIFILPTLSEGFPRVLYEAMSQSIPIITTNVSGIPHLMEDGKNALLIVPESSDEIVNSVKRLLSDGILRRTLIKGGHEIIRDIVKQDTCQQLTSLLKTSVLKRMKESEKHF